MNDLLQLNVLVLYFLYGLSFYTLGIAIALQYRSYSSYRLANSLSLLAVFALLHGLSEWGSFFMQVKIPNMIEIPFWKLLALQRLLQSVSFYFLFCFGVKLIADSRNQNFWWWFTLPTSLFFGWLSVYSHFVNLVGTRELLEWLLNTEFWSRYLLAFPAGVVTAYGLALQLPEVKKLNEKSVLRNLKGAILAFGLFALFSGLVLPQTHIASMWRIFDAATFQQIFRLPIEVFRTATAFLATGSMTRMLGIFDLEKQRQIAESKRLEAVYRERQRFARDLHDDVIQSIFGVGLDLQTTLTLLDKDKEQARKKVTFAVTWLNKVILTLREYIHGLEKQEPQDIKILLQELVEEFNEKGKVQFRLNCRLPQEVKPNLASKMENWQKQLLQIVREAFNNVVHHAETSKAQVDVDIEGNSLVITVIDQGVGLPVKHAVTIGGNKHWGLKNIKARAQILGGSSEISSQPGQGTKLVVTLPLAEEHGL